MNPSSNVRRILLPVLLAVTSGLSAVAHAAFFPAPESFSWLGDQRAGGLVPGDAFAVCTDVDRNVIAGGQLRPDFFSGRPGQFGVGKWNPNGTNQWVRSLTDRHFGEADVVAADASGNVIAAGATFDDQPGSDAARVAKWDPDGNLIWSRELRDPQGRGGLIDACLADSSGDVIVLGSFNLVTFAARLAAANGQTVWENLTFDRAAAGTTTRSLVQNDEGDLFLGGRFSSDGTNAYEVEKLDPTTGDVVWTGGSPQTLFGAAREEVQRLALDDQGNLFSAGAFLRQIGSGDYEAGIAVTRLSTATGDAVWRTELPRSLDLGTSQNGVSVAVAPNGTLAVLGPRARTGTGEFGLSLLNAGDGTQVWEKLQLPFSVGVTASSRLLAVDGAGHIFAGCSASLTAGSEGSPCVAQFNLAGDLEHFRSIPSTTDRRVSTGGRFTGFTLDNAGELRAVGSLSFNRFLVAGVTAGPNPVALTFPEKITLGKTKLTPQTKSFTIRNHGTSSASGVIYLPGTARVGLKGGPLTSSPFAFRIGPRATVEFSLQVPAGFPVQQHTALGVESTDPVHSTVAIPIRAPK